MIPLGYKENVDNAQILLDAVRTIGNEVSRKDGGIWDCLNYFVSKTENENREDIEILEKAIRSVHTIHSELDKVTKVTKTIIDELENESIKVKEKTYLSKIYNEGDDLK